MNEADEQTDVKNCFLDPDHPMLAPFQKALKAHLENQIKKLKDDILFIDSDIKTKEKEVEDLGVQAYEVQQQVCFQQKVLDDLVNQIKTLTASQESEEQQLKTKLEDLKTIKNQLFDKEKLNKELTYEIENLSRLIHQLSTLENDVESHIISNKRQAEKMRKDNEKLAKQKRKQDYLIYQLNTEVWKTENEIENGKLQIKLMEEELEEMDNKISIGNTNITALESELRALTCSIDRVVCSITNRDKNLECLTKSLNNKQEQHKTILNETNQLKKLIKQEQMQNQCNSANKNRIHADIKANKIEIDGLLKEKLKLDREVYNTNAQIEQLESDIKSSRKDQHFKKLALDSVLNEYKRLSSKKLQAEQEIFECIQAQMTTDMVDKKNKKELKDISDKIRDVDLMLHESLNRKIFLTTENDMKKNYIGELEAMHSESKRQENEMGKLLDNLSKEFEKYTLIYRNRNRRVMSLNEQVQTELVSQKSSNYTKSERKIVDLTKSIGEEQSIIKAHQRLWIREQQSLLILSSNRREQIARINTLKKQLMVLEQKNFRNQRELEDVRRNEEKIQQMLNILSNKLTVLSGKLVHHKHKKNNINNNNAALMNEYEAKLKQSELDLLSIAAEIAEVEQDKVALSKELLDVNREGLEWEKKFQVTKEYLNSARSTDQGDVANMRSEIHKMRVIYDQLKRAQEKLLKDLQQCLFKREMLYFNSDVTSKAEKDKKTGPTLRSFFQKKLADCKNKIKHNRSEIKAAVGAIKARRNRIEEMQKEIKTILEDPVMAENYKSNVLARLNELKVSRQFKFEILVFQQKKASMYSHIAADRTPFTVFRRESDLVDEYQKQKETNAKLRRMVASLIEKYPKFYYDLTSLGHSLEIVSLFMYRSQRRESSFSN
ncbi:unnamed protein product [Phyllotreta striolata]|uniref:Uncharacterized protein n=1 Tax=Phyllotreta striolata TaxID=444603 RepID=A0A9N9TV26_PHYSR|nr:unnamed protein product [Phyllotreta striolata]